MYPVSAVLTSDEVMLTLKPGQHGSTYGGRFFYTIVIQTESLARTVAFFVAMLQASYVRVVSFVV